MNLQKLKAKLEEVKIPKDAYCLEGGLPNDMYCVEKTASGWEVYYSERGKKNDVKVFRSEEEACNCFYEMIVGDLKGMG